MKNKFFIDNECKDQDESVNQSKRCQDTGRANEQCNIRPQKTGTFSDETQNCKTTKGGRIINLPKYLHDYDLEVNYCMLSCAKEPKTFREAEKCPEWREAISKELSSHEELGTWSPATLPEGAKAIETRWVFKQKDDGTKKARLVAKGFQLQAEDNEHIYAPVDQLL